MKNYLFISLCLIIGLTSCDDTYQYDVYAKNTTSENITVVFKSLNNVAGDKEQSILLKAGESKRIISTSNISPEKENPTSLQHCNRAAEYVRAFKESVPSKLEWCNENIKFELEDIGQWTFTIEYGTEHF